MQSRDFEYLLSWKHLSANILLRIGLRCGGRPLFFFSFFNDRVWDHPMGVVVDGRQARDPGGSEEAEVGGCQCLGK